MLTFSQIEQSVLTIFEISAKKSWKIKRGVQMRKEAGGGQLFGIGEYFAIFESHVNYVCVPWELKSFPQLKYLFSKRKH